MGSIGSAKCGELRVDAPFYALQVAFGQHHVGVENEKPLTSGALGTVVAALPGPAVGLLEILYIKSVGILVDHSLAVALRTVFDDENLEIVFHRLPAKTL